MKAGRPSTAEQDEIRKTLFEYYSNYKSITYTVNKTGYNHITVAKYFKEFGELQLAETNECFIQRQKLTKDMVIMKLDTLIDKAEYQLKKLETLMGYNEDDDDDLLASELDITERVRVDQMINKIQGDLVNWNQQKASIETTPTLDIKIEELVDNRLKELDARESEIERKEAELNKR